MVPEFSRDDFARKTVKLASETSFSFSLLPFLLFIFKYTLFLYIFVLKNQEKLKQVSEYLFKQRGTRISR